MNKLRILVGVKHEVVHLDGVDIELPT